jgi:hypothetical protein
MEPGTTLSCHKTLAIQISDRLLYNIRPLQYENKTLAIRKQNHCDNQTLAIRCQGKSQSWAMHPTDPQLCDDVTDEYLSCQNSSTGEGRADAPHASQHMGRYREAVTAARGMLTTITLYVANNTYLLPVK